MDMTIRPRRLRGNDTLRRMVRETRMDKSSLIYPMFVKEGNDIREEIPSMDGQYRYSVDCMGFELERLLNAGVKNVMFLASRIRKTKWEAEPTTKMALCREHFGKQKEKFPELYLITDVCMCEYTSHGHCGMLCGHDVDNDRTLDLLAKTALSHVEAGADMVAPSDMMDGRVRAIRTMLDQAGHTGTPIMSYAVKYASAFYGPFREAAGSAPSFGDRKTYQMDFHNKKRRHQRGSARCRRGSGYHYGKTGDGLSGCDHRSAKSGQHTGCSLQRQRRICYGKSRSQTRLY